MLALTPFGDVICSDTMKFDEIADDAYDFVYG